MRCVPSKRRRMFSYSLHSVTVWDMAAPETNTMDAEKKLNFDVAIISLAECVSISTRRLLTGDVEATSVCRC